MIQSQYYTWPNLNAESEDRDDKLEHECKSKLPERSVDPRPRLSNRNCMVRIREVSVDIVTDVHLVGYPALSEEQIDQLACIHPGVLVGVGDDCSHCRHRKHLPHRVSAKPRVVLSTQRNNSFQGRYWKHTL